MTYHDGRLSGPAKRGKTGKVADQADDPALTARPPRISVIVPVKDEEESIHPFVRRVTPILEKLCGDSWELLFIDDGSSDRTLPAIACANAIDHRISGISLSRSFGKEAALSAGLDHCLGEAVVPMDVDLQDPPEVLVEMVDKWESGFDVVYGVRRDRSSDNAVKRYSAGLYYQMHNWLSADKIPVHAGDFRLLDRKVVDVIKQMPERNRFMKGLFAWSGFTHVAVEYDRVPRVTGKTKYSYWKLWTLAIDGITSASTVPLRLWSYIGALCAAVALMYAGSIAIRTLALGIDVPGYASIMVSVLFLGGIQLISLGVLGEYVGRILIETKQRPIYIVRTLVGSVRPQDSENESSRLR